MISNNFPTTRIPQSQIQILVQQFSNRMPFGSPPTRHVYQKAVDQLLAFSKSRAFRFTPADFERFRLWLINEKKLSNNTVNTYLTATRRFCEFLVDLGVLQKNPAWSVHGSAQNYRVSRIPLSEVAKIISAIDRSSVLGRRDYAFLDLMFECGASISELILADIGDLKRSGKKVELHVKPKGAISKREVIKLTESASGALFDYIDSRGMVSADDALFTTVRAGRSMKVRLSMRGVRAAMRKRLRTDSSADLRLDSIRTYCVVRLMHQGKTSEEIRGVMRFKSNLPFRKIMTNTKVMADAK